MSQSFTGSTILDDTSSNITYTGTWARTTNVAPAYNLYNGTDHWSDRLGDTATLSFYGTSVEYWGNQEDTRGPCRVTLDGNVVTTVSAYAPVATGTPILLYESDTLTFAEHVLAITLISDTDPKRCEVDRFVIHTSINLVAAPTAVPTTTPTPVGSSPTSNSSPVSSATSITSGYTTTFSNSTLVVLGSNHVTYALSVASSNQVSPDISSFSTKSTSQVPLGAIIGSGLGAIGFLSLLILLLWSRLRRRRIKWEERESMLRVRNSDSGSLAPVITPRSQGEFSSLSSPATIATRKGNIYSNGVTEPHQTQSFGSTLAGTAGPLPRARSERESPVVEAITASESGANSLGLSTTTHDPPPAYHEARN